MVNRRNPAAGDPYPLLDAAGRSVVITGRQARGSAAARAPDRLYHGDQPVTAFGGVEAVGWPGGCRTGRVSCLAAGIRGWRSPVRWSARLPCAGEPVGNLDSWSGAQVLGLLRRCVTGFRQTVVMVICDQVAAAHSRRNSRRLVGWGWVPRRSSRVRARLVGTHARPFRIRRHHLSVAEITAPSPGSIRHSKARRC